MSEQPMAKDQSKRRKSLETACRKHGVKYVRHSSEEGSVEFSHPMKAPIDSSETSSEEKRSGFKRE
jgi:hypothetical protein